MKILIFFIALFTLISCSDNRDFNSKEWKSFGLDSTKSIRNEMVVDLIRSDTLKGKTVDEIEFLLGEPDSIISNIRLEQLIYLVQKDTEKYVLIDLDHKEKVISYRIGINN